MNNFFPQNLIDYLYQGLFTQLHICMT